MKILDKEIDFSFEDAENMDKIRELETKAREKIKNAKSTVEQCKIYKEFFDELIGEGTSKKIFGEKNNIINIIDAYQCLVIEAEEVSKRINERNTALQNKIARYK